MGKDTPILQKWSPNLNYYDESVMQAPVWVKLLGMPLEFWVEEIFQGIVNTFGELLYMDPMTISRRRLTYARIYVRVIQEVDIPKSITLQYKLGV